MSKLVHSRIIGTGKPLLILHGFLGMSDNWKSLGTRFAENSWEVHLIDQRNHGRSFWSDDFSYEFLVSDILNYLQHHGLTEVVILGHSMGGKTAMRFAADHPEMVEKLLVADIGPKYYPPHHQPIIDALRAIPIDQLESRVQADEVLSEHLVEPGIRQFLLKNLYWNENKKLGFRFNLQVLGNSLEAVGEALPARTRFVRPTLFLYGERSDYITRSDFPQISRQFPSSRVEPVSYAGHWLHSENPGEFMEKSLAFLNS